MNVQGTENAQHVAQLLMNYGAGGGAPPPQGLSPASSQLASITNDQGQSLLDIRGEMQGAVKDALQNYDGTTDLRTTIQDAIGSTLDAHGFDAAEVKGAMKNAGFDRMQAMGSGGGSPLSMLQGSGGGFDPAAMLDRGGTEEELIDAFLQQFRAGTHLDLVG